MKELNRDVKISPYLFRLETEHFTEQEAEAAVRSFESIVEFMKDEYKYKYIICKVRCMETYWTATILIEKYEHKSNGDKGPESKAI